VTVIPAPIPPPPVLRSFTCDSCTYGVTVFRPPARCPMCGDQAWTLNRRRPPVTPVRG
jgi:hypothetical protein